MYFSINRADPSNIVKQNKISDKIQLKKGNLVLGDYGYLAVFSLKLEI